MEALLATDPDTDAKKIISAADASSSAADSAALTAADTVQANVLTNRAKTATITTVEAIPAEAAKDSTATNFAGEAGRAQILKMTANTAAAGSMRTKIITAVQPAA
jgi:hypothetical protein